jgi:hypothetical protein
MGERSYLDVLADDLQAANIKVIVRDVKNRKTEKQPGEVNYLRIWKLGNLDHKIMPRAKAFDKLREALEEWDGYSTMDFMWGPDLQVEVFEI